MNGTRMAEIYTVWKGFKFQCHCGKVLEEGDKFAQLDDDSSTVLCLDCLSKHQGAQQPVGPKEFKPKRAHRRKAEWMECD